jgi:ketosteroid isomerase-like protein
MYAESLVKAAERSVKGKLDDLASYSFHQPAFFTSKQALERRVEMIMNTDRVRVLAQEWRYLILPAVLIFTLAVLLAPDRQATAQQLQKKIDEATTSVKEEGRRTQEWLAMRRVQALGKTQTGKKDMPPPPPPPKPTPKSLNDSTAVAKTIWQDQNDEKIVMALLRRSGEAAMRGDMEFFKRALADDYQAIYASGEVATKGEDIAYMKKQYLKIKITKVDLDDLRLKGAGNSMVATFLHTIYYHEDDGKEKIVQSRNTVNFNKRQGGWQIVGWHQTLKR